MRERSTANSIPLYFFVNFVCFSSNMKLTFIGSWIAILFLYLMFIGPCIIVIVEE